MRKKIFSLVLLLVLIFTNLCNDPEFVTTVYAGETSDVAGYETLYKSSGREIVEANVSFGKSVITDTAPDRNIFGHVFANEAHDCTLTIMINGDRESAYSQKMGTVDWLYDSSSGLYSLPLVYEPSKVNITMRSFSIELLADDSFPVFVWIGQKYSDGSASSSSSSTSLENSIANSSQISQVPKISKVATFNSVGYYFETTISNWKDGTDGAEYQFCKKDGTVVDDGECYRGDKITSAELAKRQVYYVRARFYVYDNDYNKIYSNWGQKKFFISSPELDSPASAKTLRKNSAVIKWNKVAGAKKYEIYCSTKPNSGYKKIGTTTKTSFKVTKLGGKKINFSNMKYFQIRAVAVVNGKTIKSDPFEYMYLQYQ